MMNAVHINRAYKQTTKTTRRHQTITGHTVTNPMNNNHAKVERTERRRVNNSQQTSINTWIKTITQKRPDKLEEINNMVNMTPTHGHMQRTFWPRKKTRYGYRSRWTAKHPRWTTTNQNEQLQKKKYNHHNPHMKIFIKCKNSNNTRPKI